MATGELIGYFSTDNDGRSFFYGPRDGAVSPWRLLTMHSHLRSEESAVFVDLELAVLPGGQPRNKHIPGFNIFAEEGVPSSELWYTGLCCESHHPTFSPMPS